jgi:hypothetical protein
MVSMPGWRGFSSRKDWLPNNAATATLENPLNPDPAPPALQFALGYACFAGLFASILMHKIPARVERRRARQG